jgi:hypothetical protein
MQCKIIFNRTATSNGKKRDTRTVFALLEKERWTVCLSLAIPCRAAASIRRVLASLYFLLLESKGKRRKRVWGDTPVVVHYIATVLHPIDRHTRHTHISISIFGACGMPRMHAARMLFRPSCLVHSGPALLWPMGSIHRGPTCVFFNAKILQI